MVRHLIWLILVSCLFAAELRHALHAADADHDPHRHPKGIVPEQRASAARVL